MPKKEWFQENPKVSAYLSPVLNQLLKEWMEKNGIKKTTQALTAILEEFLGVTQSRPIQPNLDMIRIESLEEKVESLSREMERLTQTLKQLSSNPKVDQTEHPQIEHPGQLSFLDIENEREEVKSSLNVKQSRLNPESQADVEPKPSMSTKELAKFLGWTEDKINSQRKRGNPTEAKGYRFTSEKSGNSVVWKSEALAEPKLPPKTYDE
jgi:DNA repair exonuclease SbcCD ATPase subunit